MKKYLILISIVSLLLCKNFSYAADEEIGEYLPYELPSIIIAYNLYSARYDEFKILDANSQNSVIKIKKALGDNISTGMAFTHRAFIVQDNIKGHLSGFLRIEGKTLDESKVPFENFLFVTVPIESFDNRILVILSQVSPERTTIFSVSNRLITELLYDSFDKNVFEDKKITKISSIYNFRVIRPGHYLLEERTQRDGNKGFTTPLKNRKFFIDVTKDVFDISLKTGEKDFN